MKSLLLILGITLASQAFGVNTPSKVVLIASGYETSSVGHGFSFRQMADSSKELREPIDVMYMADAGGTDHFQAASVVGDISYIYDLGERTCSSIKSSFTHSRSSNPYAWLGYSDIGQDLHKAKSFTPVHAYHCYLTFNNSSSGRILTLFYVEAHELTKSVTISQIEVLDRLDAQRPQ